MTKKKKSLRTKLLHAGGWQLVKRGAKMLPFGGTFIAIGLVGHDIKKKGLLKGVLNSGLDAIPLVGLAKNGVEIFVGDFIPDKPETENAARTITNEKKG
jgi:hypothetical protein